MDLQTDECSIGITEAWKADPNEKKINLGAYISCILHPFWFPVD